MNLDDLARVHDEDLSGEPAGQASGAGAQTLLASIMSEPPGRGDRPRATWLRGPVPWLTSAASVVATVLVVAMVTAPNAQQPAPPPAASPGAQPSARQMLLAAATTVAVAVADPKAPVSGAYWRTSTVSGRDVISPDRGYVIRRLSSKDQWLARRPGEQSWWIKQSLGAKPLTPEDQTAWREAGSPTRWKYPIGTSGSSEVVRAEAEEKTAARLRGKWKGSGGLLASDLLTWDEIRRIPSGERELRAYLGQLITAQAKAGYSPQDPQSLEAVLQEVCMEIVFDLPASPAVRASAYRILATMPWMKSLGKVKDPLGRTGEAFGYQVAPDFGRKNALEVALVIDPATGLLLARTTTTTVELAGGRTAKTTSFTAYQRMGWTDAKPSLPAKRD
ncbi:CU044_5270 family protein [Streptosporangium canum]|uniref:CU044_5270 family protein n=1 Tax=Streptosporangium canum TaxID=324952 RepID=UPI0033BA45B9